MHSFLREINAETRQLSWRITSKCESEPGINFPGFFNALRKAHSRPLSPDRHWRTRRKSKRSTTFAGGFEMFEGLVRMPRHCYKGKILYNSCIDFLHLTILKMYIYHGRREVEQWLKKVQVHLAGSKIIQIRY